MVIKHRNEACEKQISEVIRNVDNRINSEECAQNKHAEYLERTHANARDSFKNSTANLIKYETGLNMHGNNITR